MSADIRHLLRRARAYGLTVTHTRGGHYELRRGQQAVTVPSTPGRGRSMANTIAEIRRHLGVDLRTAPRPERRRARKDNPT